jgi:hypothetical protein
MKPIDLFLAAKGEAPYTVCEAIRLSFALYSAQEVAQVCAEFATTKIGDSTYHHEGQIQTKFAFWAYYPCPNPIEHRLNPTGGHQNEALCQLAECGADNFFNPRLCGLLDIWALYAYGEDFYQAIYNRVALWNGYHRRHIAMPYEQLIGCLKEVKKYTNLDGEAWGWLKTMQTCCNLSDGLKNSIIRDLGLKKPQWSTF